MHGVHQVWRTHIPFFNSQSLVLALVNTRSDGALTETNKSQLDFGWHQDAVIA